MAAILDEAPGRSAGLSAGLSDHPLAGGAARGALERTLLAC